MFERHRKRSTSHLAEFRLSLAIACQLLAVCVCVCAIEEECQSCYQCYPRPVAPLRIMDFRIKQAELWREDVRDIIGLTSASRHQVDINNKAFGLELKHFGV